MPPYSAAQCEELYAACRAGYDEIIAFVSTDEFRAVYDELMAHLPPDRPQFVKEVLLDDDQLRRRGVVRPEGLLILRSAFGDRRPTLFCVKKWLPPHLRMFWENVNITFDNEFEDESVPRDGTAWRAPLPVDLQHLYLSGLLNEKAVDAIVELLAPRAELNL